MRALKNTIKARLIPLILPENPHDPEELRDPPDLCQLSNVGGVDEGDGREVGEDGEEID